MHGANDGDDSDGDDGDDGGRQHKKCMYSVIRELHYIIINWTQASM